MDTNLTRSLYERCPSDAIYEAYMNGLLDIEWDKNGNFVRCIDIEWDENGNFGRYIETEE